MKVKRLSENSVLPTKAHAGDLGYDLYASEEVVLMAGQTRLIPTGIAIQFPEGYGGLLRDRSSVATKRNLFVVAGVIDNGYIGEIMIALHNSTDGYERIMVGEKIAQLILIPTVNFTVEEVDELVSADERGTGGFGSTGT
jgi:dUTP pyrophosphatase